MVSRRHTIGLEEYSATANVNLLRSLVLLASSCCIRSKPCMRALGQAFGHHSARAQSSSLLSCFEPLGKACSTLTLNKLRSAKEGPEASGLDAGCTYCGTSRSMPSQAKKTIARRSSAVQLSQHRAFRFLC